MTDQEALESYLERLDRSLKPLSVTDRADIVIEIRSHVLDAKEKDPTLSIRGILSSMGEPESVASRYLLERGQKPKKPSKNPMIQWLVIGFLGTLGIFALTFIALIWKFTPLIHVDEKSGTTEILGGMISVHDDPANKAFDLKGLESLLDWNTTVSKSGSRSGGGVKQVLFRFTNGKAEISPAKDGKISYDCGVDPKGDVEAKLQGTTYEIDMTSFRKIRCEVFVPPSISTEIAGTNGKIALNRPTANAKLSLSNGKIAISPERGKEYRYDLHLINGSMDRFVSSDDKRAISIVANLGNGKISIDD